MAAQRNVYVIVQIALFAHFALHLTTAGTSLIEGLQRYK